MKPFKNHIVSLLTMMSALLVSCDTDIIDMDPIENNTANAFYQNEIEARQAIVGVYARLGRNGTNTDFATDYYWLTSENRSDLLYLVEGTSAQNDQLELRKYLISPNSGTVSAIFGRLYSMIKDANSLLFRTKEGEYTRYRAEARFMRAFAYFELLRSFGPVALITEPIENRDAIALPREDPQVIYAQIISDLEFAAANLDKFYTGADAGRVGSVAANALQGQVYMTMAGYPLNDASAYVKAETVFAGIIADVDTRFNPDYSKVFILENENKNDIFSIQFASGGSNIGSSLPGFISSSPSSGSPFPEWTYATYNLQGQDVRVDTMLVNRMKASGDKRLMASIDTGYWNSTNATTRAWVTRNIVTKFLEKDNTNTRIKAWNDFPRNFPIIRPADVYLYYAEALVVNGKANIAKQYVDKLRLRAGLQPLPGAPSLVNIKEERKQEFIGEGRRYFDLVRWGQADAISTLSSFAQHYHARTNGQLPALKDLLLPIPQNELNTRNNWNQNPGY